VDGRHVAVVAAEEVEVGGVEDLGARQGTVSAEVNSGAQIVPLAAALSQGRDRVGLSVNLQAVEAEILAARIGGRTVSFPGTVGTMGTDPELGSAMVGVVAHSGALANLLLGRDVSWDVARLTDTWNIFGHHVGDIVRVWVPDGC
jgi:hypothetical protein